MCSPGLVCFILYMRPVVLLVLLLLVALAQAGTSPPLTLPLTRAVRDGDWPLVTLFAGHPQRALHLRLVLGPLPDFVPAVADATAFDLPGQYAALVLPPSDPLTITELGQAASGTSLLSAPRLGGVARGRPFALAVNTTKAASDSLSLPTRGVRGALVLGPGSSVWLQWRYLVLGPETATLTNTHPRPPAEAEGPGRAQHLTCDTYDDQGRCVLRGVSAILDFERAQSVLPDALAAALLVPVGQGGLHTLDLSGLGTIATRAHVSTGRAPWYKGPPEFVASTSSADAGDRVVLGRRTLARLYDTMVFDSAQQTWTMTLSASSASDTLDPRVTLLTVVVVILSLVLLSRFYVGTSHIRLPIGLSATAHVSNPELSASSEKEGGELSASTSTFSYTPTLDRVQLGIIQVCAVLTLVGSWVGVAAVPAGEDLASQVAFWAALSASLLVGLVEATLVVLNGPPARLVRHLGLAKALADQEGEGSPSPPNGGAPSPRGQALAALTDLVVGSLHVTSATLALLAALSAMVHTTGAQASVLGHGIWALVALGFVLPALTYHVPAQVILGLAAGRRLAPWRRIGFAIVVATQLGIWVSALVLVPRWILGPLAQRLNELYAVETTAATPWTALGLVTLGTLFVLVAELGAYLSPPTAVAAPKAGEMKRHKKVRQAQHHLYL